MLLYPNCKINLGLRVIRKREDGYHDIETIFVPIYGLHDELEVRPNPNPSPKGREFEFTQEGLTVDCEAEDNLIVKCYRLMKAKYPKVGNIAVRFKKNIPFGAGLGGGSSDAAHMAIALNELFELGLSQEQLAQEVAALGADCPFFIYNRPCFAEGIGDKLSPVELDMKGIRIVLIKPDEGVSTKEAYGGIKPLPEVAGEIQKAVAMMRQKCTEIDDTIFVNDFEATVFPGHPVIAAIKKLMPV